jgi:hypothetical protein
MKLGRDVYNGTPVMYNNASGEDAIKNMLIDSVGGKWDIYAFQDNRGKFYSIASELLTLPMQETMGDFFKGIVTTETIAEGEKKYIEIENQDLFEVATVARGNNDISRQRIYSRLVDIPTERFAIKIYDDFDRFIAGRINWASLINRVKISFQNQVYTKIYQTLLATYSASNSSYNVSGTLNESTLLKIIKRVKGKTGMNVAIYGTQEALGLLTTETVSVTDKMRASDSMRDEFGRNGFLPTWKGIPCVEIPTILVPGTDNFVSGTELFILPTGLEIMKVIFEGNPLLLDTQGGSIRNDNAIEFMFSQKIGMACLMTKYFGIYEIS